MSSLYGYTGWYKILPLLWFQSSLERRINKAPCRFDRGLFVCVMFGLVAATAATAASAAATISSEAATAATAAMDG